MHEEGFEPSHRMIVGLKSTALDHSAIRAKNGCFTGHSINLCSNQIKMYYNDVIKAVELPARIELATTTLQG